MSSRVRPIRRIVTGHDASGRSVIAMDGPSPHVMTMAGVDHFGATDLWKTHRTPADNCEAGDGCQGPQSLAPPGGGTVIRVVQFPPDKDYIGTWDREKAFASLGESGAQAMDTSSSRHEAMHRTKSIDYAIVLEGEIWAVLDTTETRMGPGDILIQRGTNHAWSNRSDRACLVAFVLIDAAPLPFIAA